MNAINLLEVQRLVGRKDPTILDIGCNDGTHTQLFFDLFDEARVFSFEPDPRARERFWRTVRSPRAWLVQVALAAHDGTADFYPSHGMPSPLPPTEAAELALRLPKEWDYSGSIRAPKRHLTWHPWCKFGDPVKIPVMRLDTWARENGIDGVDFIWADVQGAEGDLIDGGLETLARTRFFYTEYSDREMYSGQITLDQILAKLPSFEILHQFSEDVLLRNKAL